MRRPENPNFCSQCGAGGGGGAGGAPPVAAVVVLYRASVHFTVICVSSQCFVFFLTLCFQFRRVPIHMHSSVMHASTHTQRSPSSTRRYLEKQRGTHDLHPHTNCAYVHVGCMYHIPTPDGPLGSIPPQPGTRNPVLRRPHAPCLHPRPSPRPALGQLHRSTSRVCCRSFRCNHV